MQVRQLIKFTMMHIWTFQDDSIFFFLSLSGPPVIKSLEYGVNDHGVYVIKCTTSGTPPTKVTWTRNDTTIDSDDGMYKPTQTLVNRTKTVYENVFMVDGSFEDAIGNYSCIAENSLGTSETVSRTIKCIPTLVTLIIMILYLNIHSSGDNRPQQAYHCWAFWNS